MNAEESERLTFLSVGEKKGCVPTQFIRDFYGLPWPLPDDLGRDFAAWQRQLRRRAKCKDGEVSRYELETFMQQKGVMPKKWMGARLGMTTKSMNDLLLGLDRLQMRPNGTSFIPTSSPSRFTMT